MEVYLPIVLFFVVFLLIVFLSLFFSKKGRIKRKLKKAVVKHVSDFRSGETAKITGRVEFVGTPLASPLSGRSCAHYYVLVEQRVSTGKSSHWRKIIEEEKSAKFVVRDENRFAIISDKRVKSYIVQDKQFRSGFMNDASSVLESYLNAHGYKSEGLLGLNKSIRYKEGILEEGEKIAVYGKGEWKTPVEVGLPEHYERVLVMDAPEGDYVYLSDDPGTV